MILRTAIFLLACWLCFPVSAQQRDSINRKRMTTLIVGGGIAYGATLVALNNAWYSDHSKEEFHFFDDKAEWKQMDKLGHFYGAFQFSHAAKRALQWTGMREKKSAIWGSALGFALMLPIELMDGYSSEYGASTTDVLANAIGSGFHLGQALLWNEMRIHPKFSFSQSGISHHRPELLGTGYLENVVKDYNGQTYWLGFDLYRLAGVKPKWLNVALGYGVNNMVNASGTPTNSFPLASYRQYYLGIDINLTHIQSRSKAVNTLLYVVNLIRIPAPAVEYTSDGNWTFHAIHF